ncbi:MAG: Rne/Rng family ribonuclease [Gammaproteobacteria bacterium]|nr:Rne/Rng family ribonuclease [Gammaproteobacteria bacterium]
MKRMLINATQREELRVALVDGQRLYDLDIESTSHNQRKSNIYKARVIRIEPSLEAAFVDYGADRHGFLPLKEIARGLFKDKPKTGGRVNIRDVIEEGQEFIVQVEKDERGNKGAALTTFVSLPGRYLVAMPNNPRAGGVSRQIEGDDRDEARDAMAELEIPSNMGLILRTAGVGKTAEELQWDLDYLLQLWKHIKEASETKAAPFLIYQDANVAVRAIRDYMRSDTAEILIDDETLYNQACDFMQQVMPHNLKRLKLYKDGVPLFTRYQIESQIESAFSRTVSLRSGGSLVIEVTEAMTSIDINSARATQGQDIEETAFKTNLEAADEIATQLRLRDVGGLIVIDFIDMMSVKNQREVENRLRDATKVDRARIQIGRISKFGLLEMSRQRLRPSLTDSSHTVCPRCEGLGTIRNTRSTALAVLRVIEEESMKESTAKVVAQVPVDVATFLLNEKRRDVTGIEERHEVVLLLIPNPNLETPHFDVERVRSQDIDARAPVAQSFEMVSAEESHAVTDAATTPHKEEPKPMVQEVARATPMPVVAEAAAVTAANGGFFKRLFSAMFGGGSDEPDKSAADDQSQARRHARGGDARAESSADGGRQESRDRGDGDRRRGNQRRRRGKGGGQGQDGTARAEGGEQRQRQQEPREQREPRAPKEPREPREPREAREPRGERKDEDRQQNPAREQEGRGPREGGGRRGRGRGGRGRGQNQAESDNANAAADNATAANEDSQTQATESTSQRPPRQPSEAQPRPAQGDDVSTSTPAASTPAASAPAASAPAASAPAASAPAASTPAASTPAASTPAASTPAASTPAASTPAASTPAASAPAASAPAASAPAASAPAASAPAASAPAASAPAASAPAASAPAASAPAASAPAASTPAASAVPARPGSPPASNQPQQPHAIMNIPASPSPVVSAMNSRPAAPVAKADPVPAPVRAAEASGNAGQSAQAESKPAPRQVELDIPSSGSSSGTDQ